MAVLHRALFTWFMMLVFFILLVLRLDKKAMWNWFIIFIPMWIFDLIITIFIIFKMIMHCKNGYDTNDMTMGRKVWFMFCVMLKLSFQVILCARLQYFNNVPLYYIMIPFWLLLIGANVEIFRRLVQACKSV